MTWCDAEGVPALGSRVSWHGRALQDSCTASLTERDAMSADERTECSSKRSVSVMRARR
ncbi:hypothetical protein GA0070216_12339 [Micromonospora matsumotoense]|uniref:Uncharacterized protein n=1 Tax=Micromonospora matsumotoense TaxID=121616 RepID=A0A1C5AR14_9ACTN|nr:hypothetical protein [Micromonospora matsumotoense]SCF47679.1 hypothetical protein GA0070216_12339 [Micromonospora matsumotoense]